MSQELIQSSSCFSFVFFYLELSGHEEFRDYRENVGDDSDYV